MSYEIDISGPSKSIIEVLEKEDYDIIVGDGSYKNLNYPGVIYFPDNVNYSGNTVYNQTHKLFYIFTRNEANPRLIEKIEKVEESTEKIAEEFSSTGCISEYKATNFDFNNGQISNDLLIIIEVDWRIKTVTDF